MEYHWVQTKQHIFHHSFWFWRKQPSVSNPHCLVLHSMFMYSAWRHVSHMLHVFYVEPLSAGRYLCERWRIGPVEQKMHPGMSKRTMWSFLFRRRVCNTICRLNGARQSARGSSCITTATVLQEMTAGVCVIAQSPVAVLCKSCMIFLHPVIRSCLSSSEYRTTTEIRLMLQSLTSHKAFYLRKCRLQPENLLALSIWLYWTKRRSLAELVLELTRVIFICLQLAGLRLVGCHFYMQSSLFTLQTALGTGVSLCN